MGIASVYEGITAYKKVVFSTGEMAEWFKAAVLKTVACPAFSMTWRTTASRNNPEKSKRPGARCIRPARTSARPACPFNPTFAGD
jgi:hypothetical protein